MPTYDYQCRACGEITEVIHAMTADGPSVCGRCGGELRRVLYPAGIIFKGSGFYRTDSRASGASGTSSGSGSASSKSAGDGASTKSSDGASKGSASSSKESGGTTAGSGSESAA